MKIKLVSYFGTAVCLAVASPSLAGEEPNRDRTIAADGVHDAGLLSFNFGPAILTSWKSAVFMEWTLPNGGAIEPIVFSEIKRIKRTVTPPFTFNRYVIADGDKNSDLVKRWLHDHLRKRLNLTPNIPASGAYALRFSYILLFSTPKPLAFDLDDDGNPILWGRVTDFKNAEVNESLMLGIPCTEQIFGWNEETAGRDLDALKSLMNYTDKVPHSRSGSVTK